MHQNTLLIIDSRHTLYDYRSQKSYKYNAVLNKTFQNLQQHFQVLVLFCHNKPDINEFYHQEFAKAFAIQSKMLKIEELQNQNFQNEQIILITHDYKNFTIKQTYHLAYYSSLIQKPNKKQIAEEQYYLNNNNPFHVSHIEQVLSFFNKPHSNHLVGYYFYPKKQNELIRYEILISNQRVTYVPIDFRFINKHQKISFLFHKLMDIYKSKEINLKQEEVKLFRQNYELYVQQNPLLPIIDKITHLDILIQRDLLNDKLEKILQMIQFDGIKIMTPKQIGLNNMERNAIIPQLKYPIIAKSKQGALCANCHIMAIVVNEQGMKGLLQQQNFNDQLIIQEIINHNSVIYKIYQLGERMVVQKRKSIPNIEVDNFKFAEGFYVFDTQKDLFTNVSMCLNKVDETQHVCTDEKELYTLLEKLSKLISKDFDLQLFGFDVIGLNSEYYIIDINHFPGYKNVDGLREQFELIIIITSKIDDLIANIQRTQQTPTPLGKLSMESRVLSQLKIRLDDDVIPNKFVQEKSHNLAQKIKKLKQLTQLKCVPKESVSFLNNAQESLIQQQETRINKILKRQHQYEESHKSAQQFRLRVMEKQQQLIAQKHTELPKEFKSFYEPIQEASINFENMDQRYRMLLAQRAQKKFFSFWSNLHTPEKKK